MTERPDLSSLRIDRTPPPKRGGSALLRAAGVFAFVVVGGFLALRWSRSTAVPTVSVGTAEATGGGSATGAGISANGYVVARTKASVSSKILGRLAWVGVTEGSLVRTNEVIARLESADYEAALLAANANVAQLDAQHVQAQRDLKRAQSLRAQDLVSDAELESAQTRLEVSVAQANAGRAQARLAEATLENTRVRAPFSGTVLRKDAEVGEIVAPSSAGGGLTRTAIVTMADLSTLEVEVDVNEAYIAQVVNGQAARITLDAYPDTSFRGAVRQVVPTADRQRATVQVKVSILDRDPRILPEMGARVDFLEDSVASASDTAAPAGPPRFRIPVAAVREVNGESVVWLIRNGRLEPRRVQAGPVSAGFREVRSGLAGGEQLLVGGVEKPEAGMRVEVGK